MQRWDLCVEHQLEDKYDSDHFSPGSSEFDIPVLQCILGWLNLSIILIYLKYQPSFLQCLLAFYSKTAVIKSQT